MPHLRISTKHKMYNGEHVTTVYDLYILHSHTYIQMHITHMHTHVCTYVHQVTVLWLRAQTLKPRLPELIPSSSSNHLFHLPTCPSVPSFKK